MAVFANLDNIEDNMDFYLELAPSEQTRNTGSSVFNQDGSPFDHSKVVKKQIRRHPLNALMWRFKNFCLDYQYYFQ